jgi:type II secretory pathway pseudopilin PulG
MLSKLTRILLALVTAFVFTGQMEAAAQHCARLAQEAAIEQASDAAADCHEPAPPAVHGAHHAAPSSPQPAHDPATHSADHCECVAALNGFTNIAGCLASNHAAPYAWLPPEGVSFDSSRPDPDLRPPRA